MKKWLILLLAFIFVLPYQLQANAAWDSYFDDVLISNSHYSNIYYLADEGVIKGYTTNKYYEGMQEFRPSNNVTKRQVATMLVRALNLEAENAPDPGFKDVTKKDGAYNEIAIATKHGFFKKGKEFKPGASMTREEMAYALVRAFDLAGESTIQFSDVPKNHPAYRDVQALAANYITTGNNGKFDPKANLTRAQFASFLTRALLPESRPIETKITDGLVPEAAGQTYIYNFYYSEMQEQMTFDQIDFTSVQGFNRSLLMTESTNDYSYIGYFENDMEMQLETPLLGIPEILLIDYPLTSNSEYRFEELLNQPQNNIYNELVMHDVAVFTINGLYKTDNQLFTNVIIVSDTVDEYGDMRVYYIAKDYGLIAVELGDGLVELDRIE